MRLTRAQLADCLGVTPETLSGWVSDGMPRSVTGGGRGIESEFESTEVIAWLLERERARAQRGSIDGALRAVRLQREQLELAQAAGQVVDVGVAARAWAGAVVAARSELLALPDRLAAAVAGKHGIDIDRTEIESVLRASLAKLSAHVHADGEGGDGG